MREKVTERLVAGISEWVRMESPTNRPDHVDRLVRHVEGLYAGLGAACARPDLGPGCARPLLARLRGAGAGDGAVRILIVGHLDTVHPVGSIDGPMPVRVENGRLHGPGALDMKGGNYLVYDVLREMVAAGRLPDAHLTVLLNTDEEIGSPYSRALIEAEARAHDYVLVVEPMREGHAVIGRFAFARYGLRTIGVPAHAGADNAAGQSAIRAMARLVEQIEGLTDMSRLVSFNVGVIQGGEFVNVVPIACTAQVLAVADSAENLAYIHAVMAELESPAPGVKLEVTRGPERPLFLPSDGTRRLLAMAQQIGAGLGLTINGRVVGGGSDGNFTGALGVPTLDGLGVSGRGPHTHGEYVDIDSLAARAELIGAMIERIAAGEAAG